MPAISDLSLLMKDALEHLGYTVLDPFKLIKPYRKYPSFWAQCHAKYRKLCFRDSQTGQRYKEQAAFQALEKHLRHTTGEVYALFIRSDLYSSDFIKSVAGICRNGAVGYQFDGLDRYPSIFDKIPLFDRFFVFDTQDVQNNQYTLLPATNFYFDHNIDPNTRIEYDFYYLGAHHPSRHQVVINFAQFIQDKDLSANLTIFPLGIQNNAKAYYPNPNISILDKIIPFSINTQLSQKARVLLDFVIDEHNGLSFRTFEALGYRKKLITTNKEIIHYEFYHPNNILVWDGENFSNIEEFLELPYHELPNEIYQKYSFGNWLHYVLDKEPYLPIGLPIIHQAKNTKTF